MKVILREDLESVGKAGQTVDVRDGYGRNFLIPRNLAIPATTSNVKAVDEIKRQKDIREKKRYKAAGLIKDRIEKLSLTAEVQVGEEDKLFGSVTSADITALLAKEGVVIDKRSIELEESIRTLGVYTIPVKIAKDVIANAKLWVIKKN